jgi:hypothetical protein
MTRQMIRIPKPRDPLQAEIARRLELKKLAASMPPVSLSERIAQAEAYAAVNSMQDALGYRRRPSALDNAAGIGEGILYG